MQIIRVQADLILSAIETIRFWNLIFFKITLSEINSGYETTASGSETVFQFYLSTL